MFSRSFVGGHLEKGRGEANSEHARLLTRWAMLNPWTRRSKFEFSFVTPVHFLQGLWGEVDKISSKFIVCDHVRNSHDHSVLQSIDITIRNLMLITLRALRVNGVTVNVGFPFYAFYLLIGRLLVVLWLMWYVVFSSGMDELYSLFFENLSDSIPSVRQGAAMSLANVVKAYGRYRV